MAFVSSFTATPLAARVSAARAVSSTSARRNQVAAPVRHSPRMAMAVDDVANRSIAFMGDAVTTLASNESDFGGYLLPILGLLTIGVIIALLTPPVKE